MKETLFALVEQYDCITIFRHVSADSDALGSQYGLRQWIKDTYPEKKVFALGEDNGSKHVYFPDVDIASDEEVASSLAIILDTANASRIDDERWRLAAHKLKIDHHIFVEQYADTEIIQDLAGATCEILARLFEKENIKLSAIAAQYLYCGMIADTLRFSIRTTTPETLRTAAYLVEAGVDVAKANEQNFSTTLKLYRYENYIRANCEVMEDKLAYMIVQKEDYERFGLTFNEAKEKVFVMSGVDEFRAWALFTEKEKDEHGEPVFNGSLRARAHMINDIASHYQGGGHRFACGVKGLKRTDIDRLLKEMLERVQ